MSSVEELEQQYASAQRLLAESIALDRFDGLWNVRACEHYAKAIKRSLGSARRIRARDTA